MGKLLAICTSPKRGTVKTEVPRAVLTPEWGIVEDAHGGNWHRQVSMLSAEKIEAFRKKIWVDYGAFGENLVIACRFLVTMKLCCATSAPQLTPERYLRPSRSTVFFSWET